MTLEQTIDYIQDDELVVRPKVVRADPPTRDRLFQPHGTVRTG